ncbi:hypothetical protein [Clostridium sp. CF012]|uniref:hypothetical protein n=1 Tax=Clostridium sp. CF012 TaxID=2843319 RepID=UPI001C0D7C64|nr:hypothetical protein [Clostridium sp. CF012]MBU3143709.1 hypothetical protein [Clostridium sp. CF012]
MNYLNKLAKNIKFNGKKQRINHIKSYSVLAVLGVVIGGTAVAILTKGCCKEIKNIDINNVEDNEEEFDGDFGGNNEDTDSNRNEIKETLEKVDEQSLGDIGVAMEHAIEELEEEEKSENEAKN